MTDNLLIPDVNIVLLDVQVLQKKKKEVTVLMCLSLKSRLSVHRCSRNCPEICRNAFVPLLQIFGTPFVVSSLLFVSTLSLSHIFPEILLGSGRVAFPPAGRAHPEEPAAGGGEAATGPRG